MPTSLQHLFQAIAQVENKAELQVVMPSIAEYFVVQRCGLFLFEQLPTERAGQNGILQKATSIKYNPVLRYLVERHAPVHEGMVTSPKAWRLLCPRADHRHVMAGPVVSNGQLVGGIGLTRDQHHPAFITQDLTDLSALCLHLSTRITILVTLPSNPSILNTPNLNSDKLTPRELQIAELVAQGLTNAKISKALWITENTVKQALKRIFRKLEVSSRAEMVSRLASKI